MNQQHSAKETSRRHIVERIRGTFPLSPLPSDNDIVPATDHLDLERLAIKSFLRGKAWDAVATDLLNEAYPGDDSAILSLCSDIAFKYYFPSFLTVTIELFDTFSQRSCVDSAIYCFTPIKTNDRDLIEFRNRRIRMFSIDELTLIKESFKFVKALSVVVIAQEIESAIRVINRNITSQKVI